MMRFKTALNRAENFAPVSYDDSPASLVDFPI